MNKLDLRRIELLRRGLDVAFKTIVLHGKSFQSWSEQFTLIGRLFNISYYCFKCGVDITTIISQTTIKTIDTFLSSHQRPAVIMYLVLEKEIEPATFSLESDSLKSEKVFDKIALNFYKTFPQFKNKIETNKLCYIISTNQKDVYNPTNFKEWLLSQILKKQLKKQRKEIINRINKIKYQSDFKMPKNKCIRKSVGPVVLARTFKKIERTPKVINKN